MDNSTVRNAYATTDSATATAPLRVVPTAADRIDQLGADIVAFAGRLNAATCRFLLMIGDFDASEGASRWVIQHTSGWLQWACGMSERTAYEHVRVARALRAHPHLVTEMSAGRLSYSHVRAISRLSDQGDELIDGLIGIAQHGTVRQLETMVRGLRTVQATESPDPDNPDEYVSHTWTDTSRWQLSARLDPERGALVESALGAIAAAEGVAGPDALVRLAELGLAALNDDAKRRDLRSDERAAIVIHLDAARIRTESANRSGTNTDQSPAAPSPADSSPVSTQTATADSDCSREQSPQAVVPAPTPAAHLADGPGLPDAVVRRLACAGRVRTVLHESPGETGNVLDVGRQHRLVSDRQFRALLLRDRGCAHPGCGLRTRLEAHHVVHWFDGGRTDLANLVLLCPRHHHAHHDGEFTVRASGNGRFGFRCQGKELPDVPICETSASSKDAVAVEDEHKGVAADAATTRWDGSRMPADAVSVVAQWLRPDALATG